MSARLHPFFKLGEFYCSVEESRGAGIDRSFYLLNNLFAEGFIPAGIYQLPECFKERCLEVFAEEDEVVQIIFWGMEELREELRGEIEIFGYS